MTDTIVNRSHAKTWRKGHKCVAMVDQFWSWERCYMHDGTVRNGVTLQHDEDLYFLPYQERSKLKKNTVVVLRLTEKKNNMWEVVRGQSKSNKSV